MTPTYTTLTIRIDRHASGYAVALDLDGDQQFDAGVRTDPPPRWTADLTAAGYGERLFAWLADHAEFQRGWAGASACRVRLCLGRDVPDLHAYPWECLRDGVTQDFIAAAATTPFSRYLDHRIHAGSPLEMERLRVLVAIANPPDLPAKKLAPIDAAVEWAALTDATRTLPVDLALLPAPCTLSGLEQALREEVHALHVVAHGLYNPFDDRSALVLAGADGRSAYVYAEDLADLVRRLQQDERRLRLVFLASCESASQSQADAWRGLAPALVQAGVPAVVAMQEQVAVETARTFAAVFYRRLLAHGRVDLAANEARSAVHTARLPGPSLPVLYARVPDGQLLAAREANEADSRQSPADLALSGAERAYLRTLQRDCNRLPLAEEMRETQTRRKERAQLANVYVDLQVDVSPNLEQVFDRLHVPSTERPALQRAVQTWMNQGRGQHALHAPDGRTAHDVGALLANRRGEDPTSHPLYAYLQSEEAASAEEALRVAVEELTALEAVAAHPHLVLLGDPGSGKSTFANHLAYELATALLHEGNDEPRQLAESFGGLCFPLRVILRRWSASLTSESRAGRELAYAALCEASGLDRDALLQRLERPDTLVLFDGLDESPAADPDDEQGLDRRRLLIESVADFCVAHPQCRVLVTCRTKPYAQPIYQLPGLPEVALIDLDRPRIDRFIDRWYTEAARLDPDRAHKAEADRDRLLHTLDDRPDLQEMAGTPLLLTMLAAVNAWAGLPESRAELYDKCVEQLLWEWEKRKQEEGQADAGTSSLLDLLHGTGLQRADVERVLWVLTYNAHEQSGAELVDLPAGLLRQKLAGIHPQRYQGWAWADRVVSLMAERGGLLVESEPEVFTFPHRTFQEYLAARWLLELDNRSTEAAALATADTWREVVLLACGYLTYKGRYGDVQAIVAELVGGRRFAREESVRRLLVGGRAWLEFGPHRATGNTGEELRERIPKRLTHLMQHRDVPPQQRLEAGLLLADLDVDPEGLDDFVPIAANAHLGYDFRIGRYPVTNKQFRRFVDDGGYAEYRPWWQQMADGVAELDRYWEGWRNGPRFWDDARFNRSTQPVVGVSWYEANAYCAWLTAALRAAGDLDDGRAVRLPTQAEWARAARSTHGGDYPWNGAFDPALANTGKSGLGQTTPVHMYPGGKTPEGVWDLAGNVWEWSADVNDSGWPWLKGGSWWSDAGQARASSRDFRFPLNWLNYRGFRCVVVPITR